MGHVPYPGCSPYSQARSWSAICALWMLSLCQASKSRSDGHWQWAGFATWVIRWRLCWLKISAAEDARDLVDVEYEPLPAVTDPEAALAAGAPVLYDEFGSNLAYLVPSGGGDIAAAFAQADHTVRLRLVNQRLRPNSMGPGACML